MKADAVLLFDSYGSADSRLHSIFLYHLEVCLFHFLLRRKTVEAPSSQHNLKVKGSGLPYEFRYVPLASYFVLAKYLLLTISLRALESIFLSVLSALEAEMVFTRNLIGGLLAELEDDIDRDKFKRLLHYSRRLTAFQNRARLVRSLKESCIRVVAQECVGSRSSRRGARTRQMSPRGIRRVSHFILDDDLAAMYLSDKKNGSPRSSDDHEELEVLLESFSKQVEEIVNEAETISVSPSLASERVPILTSPQGKCAVDARDRRAYSGFQSQCTSGPRSEGM